jgi:hypothetical protein
MVRASGRVRRCVSPWRGPFELKVFEVHGGVAAILEHDGSLARSRRVVVFHFADHFAIDLMHEPGAGGRNHNVVPISINSLQGIPLKQIPPSAVRAIVGQLADAVGPNLKFIAVHAVVGQRAGAVKDPGISAD